MYKFLGLAIGNFFTGFIVVVNIILTTIVIKLITWIGYDTHSEQISKITNGVFVAQFFNTALVLPLVQANASQIFPALKPIFHAKYYDYDDDWYAQVGYLLVQTMAINCFVPIAAQCATVTVAYMKRWLDQGFERDPAEAPYKTKKTQVGPYVTLHSGPNYMVHQKYSQLFNVTFVTCLYGAGMPLLFPIAALSYFNIYWLEKLNVAWFYKLPPSMDDKLMRNAVSVLSLAPLMFLFNGYWMVTNRQFFFNSVDRKLRAAEQMPSNHTPINFLQKNYATPLALAATAVLVAFILKRFFGGLYSKLVLAEPERKIDEGLPNFYKTVKL